MEKRLLPPPPLLLTLDDEAAPPIVDEDEGRPDGVEADETCFVPDALLLPLTPDVWRLSWDDDEEEDVTRFVIAFRRFIVFL